MGMIKESASARKSATVTKKAVTATTKSKKVATTPQTKPAKPKKLAATPQTKPAKSKKLAATPRTKPAKPQRVAAQSSAKKVTLTSLAAQIDELSAQLKALEAFLRTGERTERTEPDHTAKPAPSISTPDFDSELLSAIADLDRRGRHGGMVPIPDVRVVFVEAGWTRASFDKRLLKAEADFLVDLKVANDPSRLARPDLAIEEAGRGHLQYVVIR